MFITWRLAHPDGVRRLRLTARHGQDAGPEHLGQHRPVVERQRDHHAPVGAGLAAVDAVGVEDQDHQQQHRHRAEELHDRPARPADPGVVGELADAEDDPEHHRDQDRAERHLQGVQQAVDSSASIVGGGDERLPHVVLELAGLVEPPDDEGRATPSRTTPRARCRSGAGRRSSARGVEEDAARPSSAILQRARAGSRRTRRSRPGARRSGRRRGRSRSARSASSLVKSRIRENASATPKTPATVVFFSSAICTLASGGTDARNAWGSTTWVITPPKGSPIARAASAWPSGTALMPERSASQTKAEV